MGNGNKAWRISPSKYVQEAVHNCENYLTEHFPVDHKMVKNAPTPFTLGYEPKIDTSPELLPEEALYYQAIIGVMR